MVWAIDIGKHKDQETSKDRQSADENDAAVEGAAVSAAKKQAAVHSRPFLTSAPPRRRGPFSPLMRRILVVNLIALLIIVGGIFYLTEFRERLIVRKIDQLMVQAEILAGAIGESATQGPEATVIDEPEARLIIARLVGPSEMRARLFNLDGSLMIDSRFLATSRAVVSEPLPPLDDRPPFGDRFLAMVNELLDLVTAPVDAPLYREVPDQQASDYIEVISALAGEPQSALRQLDEGSLLVSAAFPVQRFRRVLGALMVSADTRDIEQIVRAEQITILKVSGAAIAATLLLSVFLASTIARPIRRLAQAAERVRRGLGRESRLPQLKRNDEIGDLSQSLSEMTQALYRQIDAVEAFAADVAHELKNPLSSLRSAVDSLARTDKAAVQRRLMAIIQEDVRRLDRLISDISDASRLDAELTRARMDVVDLGVLISLLVEAYRARDDRVIPEIRFREPEPGTFCVYGLESRLGQVIANLIDNAISFSPDGGVVQIDLKKKAKSVIMCVEDDGPGLPEGASEKIFQRFYSERPESESFGNHSGLGLSISQQIIEAHNGTIMAENRLEEEGEDGGHRILGARFRIVLPKA